MAKQPDGTDPRGGKPVLSKGQVSGKVNPSYGKGSAKSMGASGTVSGKETGSYGTKAARNSGGNVNGGDQADRSAISKSGGKWGR